MRRFRDTKGMTLLEVTVAIFVLAIGLLGLAGLQLITLRSDTVGHQATLATTLAKDKLAELQKTEQLMEGTDQYVDKVEGMTYVRQWTVKVDVPQPEMTTVQVQVSWRTALADRAVIVSAKSLWARPPAPRPEVASSPVALLLEPTESGLPPES